MRAVLIVASCLLAGCGSWSKPGGTPAQLEADRDACAAEVFKSHPPRPMVSPTSPAVVDQRCANIYGPSQCAIQGGQPWGSTLDLNAGARSAAFDRCLQGKGYTFSSR